MEDSEDAYTSEYEETKILLLATFPNSCNPGSTQPVNPTNTWDTGPIEQTPLATPVNQVQYHSRYLFDG